MIRTGTLFILLYILALYSSAHISSFSAFRAISPPEGFTYGGIVTITEDPHGMIWFGTQHGLYYYDTETFRKFLHKPDEPNTPSGNNIRHLYCDSAGKIWVSTSSGLSYYDFEFERFHPCLYTDNEGRKEIRNVIRVFEDRTKQLWLIDQRGLAKIDSSEKKFIYRKFDNSGSFSFGCIDNKQVLWLGTNDGHIYKSSFPYDSLQFFARYRNALIQSIMPGENEIWIGYDWHGADKADYNGNLSAHYSNPSETGHKIANNRVRCIYRDNIGQVWLATYKGITIINGENITNFDAENYPGINHNSIFTFYEDHYGGMWAGTWSGGLYYRNLQDNQFFHGKDLFFPNLNTNVISSFSDGPSNTIWVGTESGMIFSFDPFTKEYNSLLFDYNHDKLKSIKSMLKDSEDNLWIGTFSGGLWVKTKNGNLLQQIDYLKNHTEQVYSLAEDEDKIWIGTGTTGLHSYSLKNGKTEHFRHNTSDIHSLSNNSVRCVLVDNRGNLWAGTMHGLNYKLKEKTSFNRFMASSIENHASINHDEIFCLHEDRAGNIWIGTGGGGLNKYDPVNFRFEYFTTEHGLAGMEIYGILEDNSGNIWVSTENGISMLDPKNITFRNFIKEDGLQGNQFNPGACYRSASGWMFFGGSNGFSAFLPSGIRYNPLPPLCHITEITVNHEPLNPGLPLSPLKRSIKYTNEIELPARQNSLTISFVATNYLQPNKNRFKYRLINYDENWIEAGSERKATFTKIPPGSYVFEVMASNNDGVWNIQPRRLAIKINPPLLLNRYSIAGYLLIATILLYLLQREIRIRQKLKLEVQTERFRRENEEQLSQMKMSFLTNISHEFKTPLSLIISPADTLMRKFGNDAEANFLLKILKRNTTRLQWLINQVIDIRKIEMNKLELVKKQLNIVKICYQITECFYADAIDKNIGLSVETDLTDAYIVADTEKIDIIITNLVSNAMKFTNENGKVTLSLKLINSTSLEGEDWHYGEPLSGKIIKVTVADNGPGVEKIQLPYIFERFTQGKGHTTMGAGIGLSLVKDYTKLMGGFVSVKSTVGEGSEFSVCFPVIENFDGDKTELQIQHPTQIATQAETEIPAEPTRDSKNICILVVEDDADTRSYMTRLLKKKYRVIAAGNGKQGYEKAVAALPDIIISDLKMPGVDGHEMVRLLKNNKLTKHIPIIMVSAQIDPEGEIDSIDIGADAFLTKPFQEDLLFAYLRKVLLNIAGHRQNNTPENEAEQFDEEDNQNGNAFMERALLIIEKNMLNSEFSVEKLAQEMNVSRTSLYRRLKLLTGQSATEFIRHARLKKALSLMETSNLSIEEISIAVGFNSHSYFSHCFRQHFGKKPSELMFDRKFAELHD